MKDIDTLLKEVKRIHFIGIGGSGMCPLAESCCPWAISCPARTITTPRLFRRIEKEGAKVYLGQTKANLTPDHSAGDLHQRHLRGQRGAGMG